VDDNDVRGWIEGYVAAWNSNEPTEIARLFTADAEYYTDPYGPPWVGRDRIVEQWLVARDQPGETSFEWQPLTLTGDLAIVTGTTTYPHTFYSNLWVIRLDEEGRCREFTEWWMEHPRREAPAD
jgi:ketosteroid isomerase-like protein